MFPLYIYYILVLIFELPNSMISTLTIGGSCRVYLDTSFLFSQLMPRTEFIRGQITKPIHDFQLSLEGIEDFQILFRIYFACWLYLIPATTLLVCPSNIVTKDCSYCSSESFKYILFIKLIPFDLKRSVGL